jgi:hypothetical protein
MKPIKETSMGLKAKTRKSGRRDGQAPEVEFGRLYRDHISGFEGKATGFCSYISGCDQVLLMPGLDKDGKRQEGVWFDDDRLIDVELEEKVERTSQRGGPQQSPSRTS